MKKDVKYDYQHWVTQGARRILKMLDYDVDKGDIHQQFLDRHNLERKEKKIPRVKPKKDLPND